jgi:hypothetical protein
MASWLRRARLALGAALLIAVLPAAQATDNSQTLYFKITTYTPTCSANNSPVQLRPSTTSATLDALAPGARPADANMDQATLTVTCDNTGSQSQTYNPNVIFEFPSGKADTSDINLFATDVPRIGVWLETNYAPTVNNGQQTGNWYQIVAGGPSGALSVKVPVCTTGTLNGSPCTNGQAKITVHAGMTRDSIDPVAYNGVVNSTLQVNIVYP